MKLKLSVINLLISVLLMYVCQAQVDDIGIDFKKKGYVRELDSLKKYMIIDFITDKDISTVSVLISEQCGISVNGKNGRIGDLVIGSSVIVEGEVYRKKNLSMARVIQAQTNYDRKLQIKDGRIDAILDDYAIIDGRKVKLASKTIIQGVDGYKKKFLAFRELMLGDIVNLKGEYSEDGFLYAKSITVGPDLETDYDKLAKSDIDVLHKFIYTKWHDKSERKKLLGLTLPVKKLLGQDIKITRNQTLQEYVNTVGMKLIPEHYKSKLQFVFILIDNVEANAFVLPNGLAFIYTGLFEYISNEAQLASVLGHEIGHAIYEHSAKRFKDRNSIEDKIKKMRINSEILSDVMPNVKIPVVSGSASGNSGVSTQTLNSLFGDLHESVLLRDLAKYSMEDESQADRVGLYLMTKAGYDSREATIFWKTMFNLNPNSGHRSSSYFDPSLKEVISSGKYSSNNTFAKVITSVAKSQRDKNISESKQTHPDNLSRFCGLHEMIGMFWSRDKQIERSNKGYKEWLNILQKAVAEKN